MDHYDVIIVGAGISGALVANELAAKGIKVLILEAGTAYQNRQEYLNHYYNAYPPGSFASKAAYPMFPQAPFPDIGATDDYYDQSGPNHERFKASYLRMAGGSTLHWLGTALRFHPNDFKIKTLYHVADDWPISYEELEPWYCKAESELGVAGDSSTTNIFPRSQSYPMPPIPIGNIGELVQSQLNDLVFDGNPVSLKATPQARNSINGYQDRPACQGFHSCIPICPIQAKYDALVHLKKAEKHGAQLQTESVVYRLNTNKNNRIESLDYLRWDGSTHRVAANYFVLAAHGIETPKILLNSRNEHYPHGIANRSGQVGRRLMDHAIQLSYAMTPHKIQITKAPFSTSGIESIIDGAFRKSRGSFRVEISNKGWAWPENSPFNIVNNLMKQGIIGDELNQAINKQMSHQLTFSSLTEVLPRADNHITLSDKTDTLGIPRPRIHYKLDEYTLAGLARARELATKIFQRLDASEIHHFPDEKWQAGAHIMGTTAMGNNPTHSVVDKNGQSHDHANLYIVGSSVFTTGSCVNPTLTLAALALKTADHMKKLAL